MPRVCNVPASARGSTHQARPRGKAMLAARVPHARALSRIQMPPQVLQHMYENCAGDQPEQALKLGQVSKLQAEHQLKRAQGSRCRRGLRGRGDKLGEGEHSGGAAEQQGRRHWERENVRLWRCPSLCGHPFLPHDSDSNWHISPLRRPCQ